MFTQKIQSENKKEKLNRGWRKGGGDAAYTESQEKAREW